MEGMTGHLQQNCTNACRPSREKMPVIPEDMYSEKIRIADNCCDDTAGKLKALKSKEA